MEYQSFERYIDSGTGQRRLVPADRSFRSKWISLTVFLLIFPVFFLWAMPASRHVVLEIFTAIDTTTTTRLLIILYSFFSIFSIVLLTTGLELIKGSCAVKKTRVYPAPGMKVLFDTWTIHGRGAVLLAYLGIGFGVTLILAASSAPFYFHALLADILTPMRG